MRVAFAPLTALVTVAALAIAPACGFPTLSYEDEGGASSGGMGDGSSHADGSGGDGGSDGTSSADGEPGGDAASDVSTSGDSPTDAASQDSAAMPDAGCVSPCDCDNDTYMAMSCGGNDCCDTDPNAHPGQTSFFPSEDDCHSYDYNCDTMQEMEWGAFSCAPGVTGCTPTSGFVGGVPGCGVPEQWTGMCKNMITSCQPGDDESRRRRPAIDPLEGEARPRGGEARSRDHEARPRVRKHHPRGYET